MVDSRSHNLEETADGDVTQGTPSEESLSPEKLSEAFAGMLSSGNESGAAPVDEAHGSAESEESTSRQAALPGEAEDTAQFDLSIDEGGDVSPRGILEAMLFVGNTTNEPLTAPQASELMRGVSPVEIDDLVLELNASYASRGCPYCIVSQDAGYRMVLRDDFSGLRDKFYGRLRQARLSPAAIEVLATVAYNQPLTHEQISKFRRVSSSGILAQLVRRQLLRIERRSEKPRAPFYYTTERFLSLFDLESLDDLPRRQELDIG